MIDFLMNECISNSLCNSIRFIKTTWCKARFSKQMKSETKPSQAVLVPPLPPPPLLRDRNVLASPEQKSILKIKLEEPVADTPSIVSDALATPIKSTIPLPVPTPSQPANHRAATTPLFLDTPSPKRGKLRC